MGQITINLSLYGELSQIHSGRLVSNFDTAIPSGTTVLDLLNSLNIPVEKQGYTFINAVLCDMPGLNASHQEVLNEKDHVGIFSTTHVWPYQYRDGVRMSESLKAVLEKRGAMHHTYNTDPE
jgi:hypothetical protein